MERLITIENNLTVCSVLGADGKAYVASAKCNPTDKFNANVGVEIATNRAEIKRADGEAKMLKDEIAQINANIRDLVEMRTRKEKDICKLEMEIAQRQINLEKVL